MRSLRAGLAAAEPRQWPRARGYGAHVPCLAAPERAVREVFRLLSTSGAEAAESMHRSHLALLAATPLEHSLQAAHRAAKVGNEDFTIAALLHDCGHFVNGKAALRPPAPPAGTPGVEPYRLGGEWLRSRGFSEPLCELVAQNGDAQRYKCHVDAPYYRHLPDSAKADIAERGGPMTPDEAGRFEEQDNFAQVMALRQCCDEATLGMERAPGLAHYRCMMEEHLFGQQLAEQCWWEDLGELGTFHVKR